MSIENAFSKGTFTEMSILDWTRCLRFFKNPRVDFFVLLPMYIFSKMVVSYATGGGTLYYWWWYIHQTFLFS